MTMITVRIQIQLLLKLNDAVFISRPAFSPNSNTTLVKVKFPLAVVNIVLRFVQIQLLLKLNLS